jgi:hypothetical protein
MSENSHKARAHLVLAAGLSIVPLLVLVMIVTVWSVDVPYWDQWPLLLHLDLLANGQLQLADLWASHNGHRLLFPRLVMIGLAQLSGWDVRWEMGFSIVMAVCLAVTIIHLRWSQRRLVPLPTHGWLWPTLLSLTVFNLSQSQNWGWGWQLQILLCVASQAACLSLLSSQGKRAAGVIAAAGLATVASYSFSCGLVIWMAALPILLLSGPGHWRRLAIWLACATLVISLYLNGLYYDQAGIGGALSNPLLSIAYLLSYLGSPLLAGAGASLSLLAGSCGLTVFCLLAVWSIRRANGGARRAAPVWISLGLVAVGSAAMTALARVGIGIDQALSSRYVTFANLLWIAVVVLALTWFTAHRPLHQRLRHTGMTATCLLVAALLVSEVRGGMRMYGGFKHLRRARDALLAVKVDGATVVVKGPATSLHPNLSVIQRGAPLLQKHQLSCFRDSSPMNP